MKKVFLIAFVSCALIAGFGSAYSCPDPVEKSDKIQCFVSAAIDIDQPEFTVQVELSSTAVARTDMQAFADSQSFVKNGLASSIENIVIDVGENKVNEIIFIIYPEPFNYLAFENYRRLSLPPIRC